MAALKYMLFFYVEEVEEQNVSKDCKVLFFCVVCLKSVVNGGEKHLSKYPNMLFEDVGGLRQHIIIGAPPKRVFWIRR